MARITQNKRDEMFGFWQEKQSANYVSKKAQVCRRSVNLYRKKDRWDKRTAEIQARAEAKVDNKLAKARANWITLGLALQNIGKSKFYNEQGKLKADVVEDMSAGEGIKSITEGVRVQREAMGEPGEISQLNVQIELIDGD